ncbi:hypothetical protein [Devosia sp.]|uniref:hypothetical protein n=1 Tax=Devosia sp. TaxID=1871048 RepID=UPI001ACD60B4|nr:hypothetical protein [Devosia sp.]MBN9334693.1 hypothetical protein [Devosia sp.]
MTFGYRIEIRATVSYAGGKEEFTGYRAPTEPDFTREQVMAAVNATLRVIQDDIKGFVRFEPRKAVAEDRPEELGEELQKLDTVRKGAAS